jgi:hypothetical protein
MIEVLDDGTYYMNEVERMIGSASNTDNANRQRRYRERQKQLALTESVTKCNASVTDNVTKDNESKSIEIEKEIEIEIEKEKRERVDYELVARMYNDTCVSFPRLVSLSDARKKAIKARLNSYTLEDFKKVFELAESSTFLKGSNSRNWSANFDWIIKDANFAKILDGNYNDKGKAQAINKTAQDLDNFYNMAQSWAESEG